MVSIDCFSSQNRAGRQVEEEGKGKKRAEMARSTKMKVG